MGDPISLATIMPLLGGALQIIEKYQRYESTLENFQSTIEELNLAVEQMKKNNGNMNLRADEDIDKLTEKIEAGQELIRKTKIRGWNVCLVPFYQGKLEKMDTQLGRSIMIQMFMILKDIQSKVSDSHRQTTADHANNGTPTTGNWRIPEFTVGLEGPLKIQLKSELLKGGGKQVLNLTGMPGLGKTTLAKHLCCDPQVKGKFKDNVVFKTLGSQIQSNEDPGNRLQDQLSKFGENPVLLVLDDVWPGSKDLVEQLRVQLQISSHSKILVTSRVAFPEFGTPYIMRPLFENDAVTLFLHSVKPNDIISSYNDGDYEIRKIVLQIVKGCKCVPLALKFVGTELRGQRIENWKEMVKEWSKGHSILDSDTELLARLQNSLHLLEDEPIKECFMDLGLFPEDQRIPVTALIDMWVELYKLDEDGLCAMIFIHQLTDMNLADIIVRRKVGSAADSYYNNHFLMQHDLLRELAIRMSKQEIFEKRKRLIVDINRNNCPDWWPQQQQPQGISAFAPEWLIAPKQRSVAARILSISTGLFISLSLIYAHSHTYKSKTVRRKHSALCHSFCSTLDAMSITCHVFADQKVTPDWCNIQAAEAEVLVLNLCTEEYSLPDFMKKMRNLKVLVVTNYGFHPTELRNFELLCSLCSLKRITLQQVSIPYLCELKNVQKLSLYMCEVKHAFENSSIQMSKLEDLNIDYCKDMVKLPAGFCDIVTLKKLSISNCHKFAALPQELGKLENLELLRVSYCADFEDMPESVTELQGLRFLDISNCISLRKLPENIGELGNLEKLYMTGCPIHELPDSVMKMEHLRSVICDEEIYDLWEVIQHICPMLNIKNAKDTTLNWLSGVGSLGVFI